MLDAWLDLVLGSRCVGCGAPGRALCAPCDGALPRAAGEAWPTPTPPGLVRPSATAAYADLVRAMIIAHKDQGRLSLARPLGALLACAVLEAAVAGAPGTVPADLTDGIDLVPVPSHPAVVRRRGHDPLLRIARVAATDLRRRGLDVRVRRLLRVAGRRPRDQAGLDASARAANLAGRFAARRGDGGHRLLLVVDDVITTGATLREAQRALEAAGVQPHGAAAVAATRRRLPAGGPPLPRTGPDG